MNKHQLNYTDDQFASNYNLFHVERCFSPGWSARLHDFWLEQRNTWSLESPELLSGTFYDGISIRCLWGLLDNERLLSKQMLLSKL